MLLWKLFVLSIISNMFVYSELKRKKKYLFYHILNKLRVKLKYNIEFKLRMYIDGT